MSDQQPLTHLDSNGEAHMVDVGDKAVTQRIATAPVSYTHLTLPTILLV